jgi:hypothetical protein
LKLTALSAASAGLAAATATIAEQSIEGPPELLRGTFAFGFRLGLPVAFFALAAQAQQLGVSLLGPGPLSRHANLLRQLRECPEQVARLLVGLVRQGDSASMAGLVRELLKNATAVRDLDTIASAGSQHAGAQRAPQLEQALSRMAAHPVMRQLRTALQPAFHTAVRTVPQIQQLREAFERASTSLLDAHQDVGSARSLGQAEFDDRNGARERWGVGDEPMQTGLMGRHSDRLQALANSIHLHEDYAPLQRRLLLGSAPVRSEEALQLLTRPEAVAAYALPAQPTEADVIAYLRAQEAPRETERHGTERHP